MSGWHSHTPSRLVRERCGVKLEEGGREGGKMGGWVGGRERGNY